MNAVIDKNNLARLRWHCRRGMLELDLLLQAFLERRFSELSANDQQLFVELLSWQDQDLYNCLVAGKPLADPRFSGLVTAILKNAAT